MNRTGLPPPGGHTTQKEERCVGGATRKPFCRERGNKQPTQEDLLQGSERSEEMAGEGSVGASAGKEKDPVEFWILQETVGVI